MADEKGQTCWFCGTNPAEPDCVLTVEMERRTRQAIQTAMVKVETLELRIPQCPSCQRAHHKAMRANLTWVLTGGAVSIALGVGLGLFDYKTIDSWPGWLTMGLFGLMFGALPIGVVGALLNLARYRRTQIGSRHGPGIKEHPQCAALIAERWVVLRLG